MMERKQIGEVFRNNVKYYMKEKHITKEDLYSKVNASPESIDRILYEKQIPSLRVALEFSYVLDVNINKLVYPEYNIEQ